MATETQTFTSSGTYTPPTGTTSLSISRIGGGGGGGAGYSDPGGTLRGGGGGGEAGGSADQTIISVPNSLVITIGAGGDGGLAVRDSIGNNGVSGGSTIASGSTLGGDRGNAGRSNSGGDGGSGNTNGPDGFDGGGIGDGGSSGAGGGSGVGAGGRGGVASINTGSISGSNGLAGTSGQVVITATFPDIVPPTITVSNIELTEVRITISFFDTSVYYLVKIYQGGAILDIAGDTDTPTQASSSVVHDITGLIADTEYEVNVWLGTDILDTVNAFFDEDPNATSSFTTLSGPPNAIAPNVAIAAVSSVAEDDTQTLTASVSGGTYDSLSYDWLVVSGGGSISGSGDNVTYNPPDVSSNTDVTVRCTVTATGTGTNAASGSSDTDTDTELFTVTAVLVLPGISDKENLEDVAISTVTLPAASGGNLPLTYSIAGLPTGLNFSSSTRRVTGTPTIAVTYFVDYTVEDNDGDQASSTFFWVIVANTAPVLPFAGPYNRVGIGTIIRTLPAASGGNIPLTYTVSENDIHGSITSFNSSTRQITVNITSVPATLTVTYMVVDNDGQSDSINVDFNTLDLIDLLGNIESGNPNLSGTLNVNNPLAISLSGTLISGTPILEANLSIGRVPDAPVPATLDASSSSTLIVTWIAPDSYGLDINQYQVRYKPSNSNNYTTIVGIGGNTLTATISSLLPGTSYDVEIRAENEAGFSEWSDTITETTDSTTPTTPFSPSLDGDSLTTITATWTAPFNGGSSILDYTLRHRLADTGDWTEITTTGLFYQVTGLTQGTEYEFQVRARNSNGNSSYSTSAREFTDFPPLVLADFDTSGLEIDVLALFESGSSPDIWGRSPRAVSGSLLDGEFDLSSGTPDPNEPINQIRFRDSESNAGSERISFHDNGPTSLDTYFGDDNGDGRDLTFYIQTNRSFASFTVIDSYDRGGGNFVIFNVPSEYQSVVAEIETGDRFIIALARMSILQGNIASGNPSLSGVLTVTNADPVNLEGDINSGSPEISGILSVIPPEGVSLSGDLVSNTPRLSGELTVETQLILADFDTTGLEIDVLALIQVSSDRLYNDPDRGGTDSPIDGELGLGVGETVISRIETLIFPLRLGLYDNNNPINLNIRDYFDTGGAGNDLTLYIQTNTGVESFQIAGNINTSSSSFIFFDITDAFATLANAIDIGDLFIFALARTVPIEIALSGDIESNIPNLTGVLTVVDPGTIALDGTIESGIPELTGILSVIEPFGITLSGEVTSGIPSLEGTLTVVSPDAVLLSGDMVSGIPNLSGILTVNNTALDLADFDSNGLTIDVLALIQAGNDFPTIWARSPRSASGSLLEGEFDLNQGVIDPDEAVTRILFRGGSVNSVSSSHGASVITLNDNGFTSLGDYFGSGGAGNDYSIYIQTSSNPNNVQSFLISDLIPDGQPGASIRGGGNFIHFGVPQNVQNVIATIASGDLFIFAIARQQVALVGDVDSGTPDISGKLRALSLANFDSTNLETEVLALIEAGDDDRRIYAVPPNGTEGNLVTDNSGISNDLTIGSNGLIKLINRHITGSTIELTETDSLNLDSYFGSGGDGNDLSLYIQTESGLVETDNISSTGSSFIIFNIPASDRSVIRNISEGDRFIIALARVAPARLEGDIVTGIPSLEGSLTVVNPDSIALSGNIQSDSPILSGNLSVINDVNLQGNIESGNPFLSGTLIVSNPDSIALLGELSSGAPDFTGLLVVNNPALLGGTLISGIPILEASLSVVNVPTAPGSPNLTTRSISGVISEVELVIQLVTTASGEEFTGLVTGARMIKEDSLLEYNERLIVGRSIVS